MTFNKAISRHKKPVRSAFLFSLLALSLVCGRGLAATIELQGQSKGNTNTWITGNLMNWVELDYIPCRVFFKSGPVNNQSITIFFPHLIGTTPGFQNLYNFTPSPNAVITSGPTMMIDPSGTWSYTFTVSITNSSSGYVQFLARLAAGAHLNPGSSLQLDGTPQSMGQLQIFKPGPGPALPDLAIVKTGPVTIAQGGTITYTLAYTNKDGAITNTGIGVQICDILPADVVVNSNTLPSGGELVGNTIFFDLPNLASHASGTIVFQALVPATTPVGRVLTNFAQILCSQDDADFSDNTSIWLTTVTNGCAKPAIINNPLGITQCPGGSATFTVGASGTAPLSYQWRKDGIAISGVTTSSYTINPVAASDSGTYDVVVTNACGSATSSGAVLNATDTTPPTISCPVDITVVANAGCAATNVALGTPLTGDNCAVATVTNNAPAVFPVGTNSVTWTVVDRSGNLNSCVQRVIVRDQTAPSITCPTNLVLSTDPGQCSRSNVVFIVNAADNCGIASVVSVPPSGSTFPIGTTTVTNTATDTSGNTARCTFSVTVVDTEKPVINCPTNIIVGADAGQCSRSTVAFAVTATDNCSVTNLTSTPPSGSTFLVGTTIVTNTATDASGNKSTCTFTVTVVPGPIVTTPPTNQVVCEGNAAVFNVVATGANLTYQWRKGSTVLNGETGSSLTLPNATTNLAGEYCVVVSSSCGTPVTNCASLTVSAAVGATTPASQTVCPGSIVSFSTTASGTGPFTYQWLKVCAIPEGCPLPGETNSTLTLQNVGPTNAGGYLVVVRGACSAVSRSATLTILTNTGAGSIVTPTNVCSGDTVTFSIAATGTGPFQYQWSIGRSETPIPGATNSTLTLTNVSATNSILSVSVTGACGSVFRSAGLLVGANAVITSGPTNLVKCPGESARFQVFTASFGLSYQWFKDGNVLTNQQSNILTIANVSAGDSGNYCVRVAGTCGQPLTNCATLTVNSNIVISTPPGNQTVCEGGTANFSITASGTVLTYQWRKGTTILNGQTNSSLTISGITTNDSGTYSITVSGACGNPETRTATLTVNGLTTATPPGNLFQNPGSTATFSTTASGTGPFTYQWKKNGTALNGETASSLVISNISSANEGTYSVVVNGACNSVEVSGTLQVNQPPTVSIATPTNGHVFIFGQNINIVANANDADGGVTNIQIFVATNTLLSTVNSQPSNSLTAFATLTNPPVGMYELRARATDALGLSATSALVKVSVIAPPQLIVLTNIFLNRQSGYYEEIVRVFNPTSFASNTVGVLVFAQSPIQVVNYTLLIDGIPYVQNGNIIPPGGFADIKIKLYAPMSVTNVPPPSLVPLVMPPVPAGTASGTPITITRAIYLADGSFLLNFNTVIGATYYVEYSDDNMVTWKTSPQTVTGTGFTAQWIDDGPPATTSFPPPSNTRFYRVLQVP